MQVESFQQSAKINLLRSRFYTSLKLKKQIDFLFQKGGKIFGRHLMLRFEHSGEVNPPFRVVFAVSSRLGEAHVRNRIKRRLREALLHILREGKLKQSGFNLAILPKKEVAAIEYADLIADLQAALVRLPKGRGKTDLPANS